MESTTLFTLMNREVKTNRARTFLKCTGECSFFAYAYSFKRTPFSSCNMHTSFNVHQSELKKKKQFFSKTGRKIPSLFNCSIPLAFLNLKQSFIFHWKLAGAQRSTSRRTPVTQASGATDKTADKRKINNFF